MGSHFALSETAIILAVLWLVVVALLGLSLFVGWRARNKLAQARAWPTVEGNIVDVKLRHNGNGEGGNSTYTPLVSYAYVVAGKGYASDRLRPGGTPQFIRRAKAESVVNAYSTRDTVRVYYDPANPKRAAISLAFQSHAQLFFRIMTAVAGAVAILVTTVRMTSG